MPQIEHAFDTPHAVRLYAEIGGGSLEVDLADVADSEVVVSGRDAEGVTVELDGDDLRIIEPRRLVGRGHELTVTARVPLGSDVAARTGSADVVARGEAGRLAVKTGSGDVLAETATADSRVETGSGDVRLGELHAALAVKCGSGDVDLDRVHGTAAISTGSGDVVVAQAGSSLAVKTGSGDVRVGSAHGDVEAATASGDLELGTLHRGRLRSRTASGDVRVGVPAGVPVYTDVHTVSGRLASDLQGAGRPEEGQDHIEIHATTVSGDVVLTER